MKDRSMLVGVLLAVAAAVLFGIVTPILQFKVPSAGALATGSLVYLGAGVAGLIGLLLRPNRFGEAPLRARDFPVLLLIAFTGAFLAPMLLVFGIRKTGDATAPLLLALEAPFTVLLSRIVHREHVGQRAWLATLAVTSGSLLLGARHIGDRPALLGLLFVVGAVAAWAFDNVMTRQVSDRDPLAIVAIKGFVGGGLAALGARATGAVWPNLNDATLLVATGGFGFGVSLFLYLRGQRFIGAARTASVFSSAPFIAVAIGVALGGTRLGWLHLLSGLCVAIGLVLHATERHEHVHEHQAMEHEHTHTHDDGHHGHTHAVLPTGPHSHSHVHESLQHTHDHGEDLHHRHH